MSLWSLHVSKHVEKKPKGQYREFLTLRQMSETPDLEKKCQISSKKKSYFDTMVFRRFIRFGIE